MEIKSCFGKMFHKMFDIKVAFVRKNVENNGFDVRNGGSNWERPDVTLWRTFQAKLTYAKNPESGGKRDRPLLNEDMFLRARYVCARRWYSINLFEKIFYEFRTSTSQGIVCGILFAIFKTNIHQSRIGSGKVNFVMWRIIYFILRS